MKSVSVFQCHVNVCGGCVCKETWKRNTLTMQWLMSHLGFGSCSASKMLPCRIIVKLIISVTLLKLFKNI